MVGLRGLANRAGAFFSGLRDGFADGRRLAREGGTGIHDDPALRYGFAMCSDCDWTALVSVDRIETAWEEHVRRDHPEVEQDPLS